MLNKTNLPLSRSKWVIFREFPGTREEVYFMGFEGLTGVEHTTFIQEAVGFESAGSAYRFAQLVEPRLDTWKVGLRA